MSPKWSSKALLSDLSHGTLRNGSSFADKFTSHFNSTLKKFRFLKPYVQNDAFPQRLTENYRKNTRVRSKCTERKKKNTNVRRVQKLRRQSRVIEETSKQEWERGLVTTDDLFCKKIYLQSISKDNTLPLVRWQINFRKFLCLCLFLFLFLFVSKL